MSQIKEKVEQRLKEVFGDEPYHLIGLTMAGSHAYGIATKDSDIDVMGVFLPPLKYCLGIRHTDQIKLDKTKLGFEGKLIEFSTWFRFYAKQNPNIVEFMWNAENMYIYRDTEYFPMLLEKRAEFLSKQAKHSYGGYAHAQMQRLKQLNKNANSNEKRLRTIETFGYDTKAASHVFRLLGSGLEILVEGAVHVLRPDNQFLLAIREGKYTYEQLLEMANKKIELIEEAYVRSSLRNNIDHTMSEDLHFRVMSSWVKKWMV